MGMRNTPRHTLLESWWCVLVLLTGIAVMCAGSTALAQEAGEETGEETGEEVDEGTRKARARSLYIEGKNATRKADKLATRKDMDGARKAYAEAAENFIDAYKLIDNPLLLYSLGQVYRSRGEHGWAMLCYHRYLEKDPEGTAARSASAALSALEETAGSDANRPADSMIDPRGICYDLEPEPEMTPGPEPIVVPEPVPEPVSPFKPASTGSGYRIGFWAAAGVTVGSAAAATITLLQVNGSLKDRQLDAIDEWQRTTGMRLGPSDACAEAETVAAEAVIDACDAGKSRAVLSNVLQGVALVSAAAAGFLFYKGYMQKRDHESPPTTALQPTITPDTVGAQLSFRF